MRMYLSASASSHRVPHFRPSAVEEEVVFGEPSFGCPGEPGRRRPGDGLPLSRPLEVRLDVAGRGLQVDRVLGRVDQPGQRPSADPRIGALQEAGDRRDVVLADDRRELAEQRPLPDDVLLALQGGDHLRHGDRPGGEVVLDDRVRPIAGRHNDRESTTPRRPRAGGRGRAGSGCRDGRGPGPRATGTRRQRPGWPSRGRRPHRARPPPPGTRTPTAPSGTGPPRPPCRRSARSRRRRPVDRRAPARGRGPAGRSCTRGPTSAGDRRRDRREPRETSVRGPSDRIHDFSDREHNPIVSRPPTRCNRTSSSVVPSRPRPPAKTRGLSAGPGFGRSGIIRRSVQSIGRPNGEWGRFMSRTVWRAGAALGVVAAAATIAVALALDPPGDRAARDPQSGGRSACPIASPRRTTSSSGSGSTARGRSTSWSTPGPRRCTSRPRRPGRSA